jgi:hypothetical protein
MGSPEELGAAEVRAFLQYQIEVEQLAFDKKSGLEKMRRVAQGFQIYKFFRL